MKQNATCSTPIEPYHLQPSMSVRRCLRNRNTVYTILVYFSFFVFGFASNLIPTALIDITEITGTTVNEISSYSFVASSVSYCISSLVGGYFGKNVNRHIYLFGAMALSGISRLAIPTSRSLTEYTIVMILVGTSNAAIDIGANSWLLEIWRHGNTNMFLQGMHFIWAIGMSISPLITEPFLSKTTNETVLALNASTGEMETTFREVHSESRIWYPFVLCVGLHAISCIFLLISYFVHSSNEAGRTEVGEEAEEKLIEEQNQNSQKIRATNSMKLIILTMAGIVIGLETGMEVNTTSYLLVFAVGHNYSKSTGAYLLSAQTICFTISRGLATIAAYKVPIEYILCFSLSTTSIAVGILNLFVGYGDVYLWIGFCMIGFGFGPFYAGLFSYLSHHMNISTVVCGFFIFLSSLFVIVSDLTVGKLIEDHLYVYNLFNAISCVLCVILYVVLRVIMSRNKSVIDSRTKVLKIYQD